MGVQDLSTRQKLMIGGGVAGAVVLAAGAWWVRGASVDETPSAYDKAWVAYEAAHADGGKAQAEGKETLKVCGTLAPQPRACEQLRNDLKYLDSFGGKKRIDTSREAGDVVARKLKDLEKETRNVTQAAQMVQADIGKVKDATASRSVAANGTLSDVLAQVERELARGEELAQRTNVLPDQGVATQAKQFAASLRDLHKKYQPLAATLSGREESDARMGLTLSLERLTQANDLLENAIEVASRKDVSERVEEPR
ncbi:hypothetical protein J2S49_001177 [Arcanobacterium wilhelmae]|uniref:Uncharacterized protein n=1 Tax=Arcanobacterium wilhelmae TaxID=1803177 RepID=A0ABT9NBL5_9ACTO|nr:hypothetical protein [Arcanobacterium wilhelmae]MDP9801101.1 hypothetical protein [Arcanobacterium wilhelmae]WFN90455.1 hypothetical protein P8A24_00920 [Arcanobacterium wilhelmae]